MDEGEGDDSDALGIMCLGASRRGDDISLDVPDSIESTVNLRALGARRLS